MTRLASSGQRNGFPLGLTACALPSSLLGLGHGIAREEKPERERNVGREKEARKQDAGNRNAGEGRRERMGIRTPTRALLEPLVPGGRGGRTGTGASPARCPNLFNYGREIKGRKRDVWVTKRVR